MFDQALAEYGAVGPSMEPDPWGTKSWSVPPDDGVASRNEDKDAPPCTESQDETAARPVTLPVDTSALKTASLPSCAVMTISPLKVSEPTHQPVHSSTRVRSTDLPSSDQHSQHACHVGRVTAVQHVLRSAMHSCFHRLCPHAALAMHAKQNQRRLGRWSESIPILVPSVFARST